jgi:TonB family protein
MKSPNFKILCFLFVVFSCNSYARNIAVQVAQDSTVKDISPVFPGGQLKMYQFVSKNFKYPEEAKKAKINGKVIVKFLVEKDGTLSNISIVKGLGNGCDEEAIRILKAMPTWSPARRNGVPMVSYYSFPIVFKPVSAKKSKKETFKKGRF